MPTARYTKRMAKKAKVLKKQKSKESASITFSQPFAATIKRGTNGKNTLVVTSPSYYQHQLNKFKPGTEVTLEVHTRKVKRTEAQNRYYWGVYLPLIGIETGEHDLDRLHELFRGKFLTEGIVEVLGQKVRMKRSTTTLGVGEFSEYIMNIESETGVQAPPTEGWGLDPLERPPEEVAYPENDLGEQKF